MAHEWVDHPNAPGTHCSRCGAHGGTTSSDECWMDLTENARKWMRDLGEFGPLIDDKRREVKGMMRDDDDGQCHKAYLDSRDLRAIADACVEVAGWLDRRAES